MSDNASSAGRLMKPELFEVGAHFPTIPEHRDPAKRQLVPQPKKSLGKELGTSTSLLPALGEVPAELSAKRMYPTPDPSSGPSAGGHTLPSAVSWGDTDGAKTDGPLASSNSTYGLSQKPPIPSMEDGGNVEMGPAGDIIPQQGDEEVGEDDNDDASSTTTVGGKQPASLIARAGSHAPDPASPEHIDDSTERILDRRQQMGRLPFTEEYINTQDSRPGEQSRSIAERHAAIRGVGEMFPQSSAGPAPNFYPSSPSLMFGSINTVEARVEGFGQVNIHQGEGEAGESINMYRQPKQRHETLVKSSSRLSD